MWDLRSRTWNRTHTPCTGRKSANQWTTREVTLPPLFLRLQSTFQLGDLPSYGLGWGSEGGSDSCQPECLLLQNEQFEHPKSLHFFWPPEG